MFELSKKTIAALAILTCLSGCHALGCVLVDTGYKIRERLTPIDEKAWQPIRGITVFSWYQGGNLVPEELPGSRSYVVPLRYKANGIVTPHSTESLQKLGQKLLSRYP